MTGSFRKPAEEWRRTLYIIWSAQFIAMLGMSLVVPFLPFYVRSMGVTDEATVAQWSGLIFAGPFLPAFFLTPVWGYLGDRYGRKLMTVRAIFGLALSQFLIGLAPSVEVLFFLRMLQGAISGFLPAALTLVSSSTPKERSAYTIGILQTATSAGGVLGPFLGGTLADAFGFRPVFFLVATLCSITGLIIIRYVRSVEADPKENRHKVSLKSNYRYVFSHRDLTVALAVIVVSQVPVFLVQPVFALYVDSMIRSTAFVATYAGGIFSVAGLFTVLSAPWWGRRGDRSSVRKNLSFAFIGASAAYALHAVVHNVAVLVVLRALLGFSLGGMLPALYAYVSKLAPAPRRGGLLGIAASMNTLANLIGAPLGGVLGSVLGLRSVFFFSSASLLVAFWAVRTYLADQVPTELPASASPDSVEG